MLRWFCLSRVLACMAVGSVGCGFIGYDELRPRCAGSSCSTGTDPARDSDGGLTADASGAGQGEGDGDGPVAGDGDHGPNQPGDGAVAEGPRCGSMQRLNDTFDGGDSRAGFVGRWYNGAQLALRNDRLEFVLGSNEAAEVTYRSAEVWDLRGSELAMEVGAGGRVTGFALRERALEKLDGTVVPLLGGVALEVNAGQLTARVLDGENASERAAIAYDPQAHRHLRIREQGGSILWEASPDRASWSVVHQEAVALDASALRVELYARGQGAQPLAWFDNLNAPPGDVPAYCPPANLRDDFDSDAIAPVWKRWVGAGTCSVEQVDGQVELTLSGSALALCGLVSSGYLDLRGAALAFELSSVPSNANVAAFADLSYYHYEGESVTDRVEVRVVDGSLKMRVGHKPSPAEDETFSFEQTLPYDAAAHRFLRFRESAGNLYWESSPDAGSWTEHAHTATPFDLSSVIFGLSAIKTANTNQATVRYDNVRP